MRLCADDAHDGQPVVVAAEDHPRESYLAVGRSTSVRAVNHESRVIMAAAIEVPVDHRTGVDRDAGRCEVVARPLPGDVSNHGGADVPRRVGTVWAMKVKAASCRTPRRAA